MTRPPATGHGWSPRTEEAEQGLGHWVKELAVSWERITEEHLAAFRVTLQEAQEQQARHHGVALGPAAAWRGEEEGRAATASTSRAESAKAGAPSAAPGSEMPEGEGAMELEVTAIPAPSKRKASTRKLANRTEPATASCVTRSRRGAAAASSSNAPRQEAPSPVGSAAPSAPPSPAPSNPVPPKKRGRARPAATLPGPQPIAKMDLPPITVTGEPEKEPPELPQQPPAQQQEEHDEPEAAPLPSKRARRAAAPVPLARKTKAAKARGARGRPGKSMCETEEAVPDGGVAATQIPAPPTSSPAAVTSAAGEAADSKKRKRPAVAPEPSAENGERQQTTSPPGARSPPPVAPDRAWAEMREAAPKPCSPSSSAAPTAIPPSPQTAVQAGETSSAPEAEKTGMSEAAAPLAAHPGEPVDSAVVASTCNPSSRPDATKLPKRVADVPPPPESSAMAALGVVAETGPRERCPDDQGMAQGARTSAAQAPLMVGTGADPPFPSTSLQPRVQSSPRASRHVDHITKPLPCRTSIASPINKREVSVASRLSNMARLSSKSQSLEAHRVADQHHVPASSLDALVEGDEDEGAEEDGKGKVPTPSATTVPPAPKVVAAIPATGREVFASRPGPVAVGPSLPTDAGPRSSVDAAPLAASSGSSATAGLGKALSDPAPAPATWSVQDFTSKVDIDREQRERKLQTTLASSLDHIRRGLGNLKRAPVPAVHAPSASEPCPQAAPETRHSADCEASEIREPPKAGVVTASSLPSYITAASTARQSPRATKLPAPARGEALPSAKKPPKESVLNAPGVLVGSTGQQMRAPVVPPALPPAPPASAKLEEAAPATASRSPVASDAVAPKSIWSAVGAATSAEPSANLLASTGTFVSKTAPKKADAKKTPIEIKSLQMAAQAARKEKEEKARRAELKELQEARQRERRRLEEEEAKRRADLALAARREEAARRAAPPAPAPAPALPKQVQVKPALARPALKPVLEQEEPVIPATPVAVVSTTASSSARATPTRQQTVPVSTNSTLRINAEFAQLLSPICKGPPALGSAVAQAEVPKPGIMNPVLPSNFLGSCPAGPVGKSSNTLVDEDGNLPEILTDDESDVGSEDHVAVGLVRPQWALTPNLMQNIRHQAHQDPDAIFGAVKPIQLEDVFKTGSAVPRGEHLQKFRARSSSGNWGGEDRLTRQEKENYRKHMGFHP